MYITKKQTIQSEGVKSIIAVLNDTGDILELDDIDVYTSAMAEIEIVGVHGSDIDITKENDDICIHPDIIGKIEAVPDVVNYPKLIASAPIIKQGFGMGKTSFSGCKALPGYGVLIRVRAKYAMTEVAVNAKVLFNKEK